jgi:hypothetical protein
VTESSRRYGWRVLVAGAAICSVAAVVVGLAGSERVTDTDRRVFALDNPHGTQPIPLDHADMVSMARAFGIETDPFRTPTGWEAIDEVRSLYLHRAPSAWYVTFTNAAPLLEPPGDRASICVSPDVSPACRFSTSPLLADVGAPSPSVETARRVARGVLGRAGVIDDAWRDDVLDESPEPVTCRVRVPIQVDCSQQILPTRAVTFERYLAPGTTAMRWSLVISPGGTVLSASGRFVDLHTDT